MNILHLDENHPLLLKQFAELGHTNHEDYTSSKEEIAAKIQVKIAFEFATDVITQCLREELAFSFIEG